jgi:hypothetical protein
MVLKLLLILAAIVLALMFLVGIPAEYMSNTGACDRDAPTDVHNPNTRNCADQITRFIWLDLIGLPDDKPSTGGG